VKKVFPKETEEINKRKGKSKQFYSQEKRREGEKRKDFFFGRVEALSQS